MNIVVVGGNSLIAKESLLAIGKRISSVVLVARSSDALDAFVSDFSARNPQASVCVVEHDLMNINESSKSWQQAVDSCQGGVDMVLLAAGVLGDQKDCEENPAEVFNTIAINSASISFFALSAANYFERANRSGVLAIVTSVAGMRGRASNYVYGSTKAQLIALAAGLRLRLAKVGVRVVDFRPGMVHTPMTAHLKKGLLMARADAVGCDLAEAMLTKDGVVFAPSFWRWVMLVITGIPFSIFKKMKI